jgi:O-antigen/teichoic acid export membrane protein
MPQTGVLRMSYATGVLLLAAALAIITGAVLQLLQYRRGNHIISRGQFVLRMVVAVVLVVIIGMIFFGSVYAWPTPLAAIAFWSIITFLTVIVILLAMTDLRLVDRQKHLQQAEIYRNIQKLQDMQNKSGKDGDQ